MNDFYFQLIDYGKYTTSQQMQISHCADLIIGTQGAGNMWYAHTCILVYEIFVGTQFFHPDLTKRWSNNLPAFAWYFYLIGIETLRLEYI